MQIDRISAVSPVTRSREPDRGVLLVGGNGTGGGLLALVTLSPWGYREAEGR